MKIILTRHGESQASIENRYQGDFDSPLTEKGIKQAKALAKRLKNESISIIYTTTLQRAYKTAEEIAKFHNVKVIPDKNLNEKSHGIYSGKKKDEVKYIKTGNDKYSKKPKDGESVNEQIFRIEKSFKKILEKKQDTLIVSHQGTLRILRHLLLENSKEIALSKEHTLVSNTAIFIYKITDKGVETLLENCSKHLEK